MNSDFDKDYLCIWCEECEQQGYIFVDKPDLSYFVICKTCGWETAEVWCPKCKMSGEFVINIDQRPSSWNCPDCQTRYALRSGFYQNPTMLFLEEGLPQTVRERIEKDFQAANTPWRNLFAVINVIFAVIALVVVGLLPMVLVFTPVPWTIPGFIVTILVFAVWWWLIGRVLKSMRERFTKQGS